MALEDYREHMERCARCSYCKFIPFANTKSIRFSRGCPSIEAGKFHAYSIGGRMNVALSLLDKRSEYTDRVTDIVFKCQACGACDIACKVCRYLEPLDTSLELRAKLVEDGQLLPQHMPYIDNLRKEDNMMLGSKADRGNWAKGLDVKDLTKTPASVLFHAGCRFSFDEELWRIPRTAVTLLKKAGVDVGIMGKDETCCGSRLYDMGYRGEFTKYAESTIESWAASGIKTVVTACADGYYGFNYLYPAKVMKKANVKVYHITQYLAQLIKEGKLKLTKEIPLRVTYHDPCHLGRLGEPYIAWSGKRKHVRNAIPVYDPPKPWRRGIFGIYDPPRDLLKAIPGLQLVEMERIREYSWCCGAGGGVIEGYPDFNLWTAGERIAEAKSTGAEAIVTACGWCERNFIDAIKNDGGKMQVFDVLELVSKAI